jgi:hypothetical protein
VIVRFWFVPAVCVPLPVITSRVAVPALIVTLPEVPVYPPVAEVAVKVWLPEAPVKIILL